MNQKYIIFDKKIAVMFPDVLTHADVATMQHSDFNHNWERKKPTSAGFFYINSNILYESEDGSHWPEGRAVIKVVVYGKSDSLKLACAANDEKLIAMALGI